MTGTTGEPIAVDCQPDAEGWACHVTVGNDAGATTHQVSVDARDLARLAGADVPAERLVEESFRFMLAREPRESILRRFDLTVIGRYFPEYELEMRRRFGG